MEYLNNIHKVGLHKNYPTTKGNIWFHISAHVNTVTNEITAPDYCIHTDHDNKTQHFNNYLDADKAYNNITLQK